MALPTVPQEKAQGAVKAEAQLAATAPPPIEPTPTQADEAAMQAVAQNAGISPTGKTPVSGNTPQPPIPNMWRIPTNYQGVLGQEHKPVMQRQEDIGYLWQALASDPNVHPIVRQIAESLKGGGPRRGSN
jgi:hypothetical protein